MKALGRAIAIWAAIALGIVLAATVALLVYGARHANRARINLQTRTRRP